MTVRALGVGAVAIAALASAGSADGVSFTDVASDAGVDFRHVNGMIGRRWLVEVMGAGAAVLDFDGDGWLDLWLVQGGPLRDRKGALPTDRLYRNVSAAGLLRFEDVTAASGVAATEYGMGIATGDIDNDGDLDVLLANYGPNQLFENLGRGRFRDATARAGVAGDGEWSVSASFADADGDGWLDLYVANYVDFTLGNHKVCRDLASRPAYCSPESYRPVSDRLYRNLGGGAFADVSQTAGVAGRLGGGLGVIADDFDGDGRTDFYVANDPVDNLLWLNAGNGRFANEALVRGVAVNGNGDAEASMGVAAADFDDDGDVDLFITHLVAETNTLYVNEGGGFFADHSGRAGVALSSVPATGFGTAWFDADNDGDLDLFSANGAVTEIAEQRAAGEPHPLRWRDQLWLNGGGGRYAELRDGGPAFALREVGRGAAFGDLDNDGDLDIVVTNNNGRARVYRNDSPPAHWLGLDLVGGADAPAGAATGAVVWVGRCVFSADQRRDAEPAEQGGMRGCRRRRVRTDGSYASASDRRVLFGLGSDGSAQTVLVRWPDGRRERFGPLESRRYHTLRRGAGFSP